MKKISFLLLGALVLSLSSPQAFPASQTKKNNPKTSAEAKKLKEKAQKEIKLTEEQIRANDFEVKRNLNELGKLEGDITATKNKIASLNSKLKSLSVKIQNLEANIDKNEQELTRLREEYLKAVKKMRTTRKNKSNLAFIFSSSSFNQAIRRMRYLKEFSKWKEKQTDEINLKIDALKTEKEDLAKAREEENTALKQQQESQKNLLAQHQRQEEVVADLRRNGVALQSHLKKKQAEADEMGVMVSQLIAAEEQKRREEEARAKAEAERKAAEERKLQEQLAEEARKAEAEKNKVEVASAKTKKDKKKSDKKETKAEKPTEYADARKRAPRNQTNQPAASQAKSSGNFADMKGNLPRPTNGSFSVTSRFGRQTLPDLPDVVYDNPGIDAESSAGASALAVFKGKVSGVYLLPGYNTVVIVNHDGYYTVYGNISSPSVKVGDSVEAGQGLGSLALSDEDSSHSTIHFEVWKNREKLNPLEWIRN